MNKTMLITGTSSGLGRATARHFQAKGWNIIATMRTPEKEAELTRLERTLVTRLDVLDTESIHSAVDVGYGAYDPLEATPLEKIRRQ